MVAADLLFHGGRVVTLDGEDRVAEALAVSGDRIVAVGSEAELDGFAGPATRTVDLRGGALLPGINDSHLHGAMLGAYWPSTWMDSMAATGGLPEPRALTSESERRAALRRAWDVLLPLGITSYTEPGLGPGADGQHGDACGAAVLETYLALAAAGELPLRVTALLLFGELDGPGDPDDLIRGVDEARAAGRLGAVGRFNIAGAKIFADGIPPMRTAWMSEPYDGGGTGELLVPGADDDERVAGLRRMVEHAHRAGCQIGVHATGDRTIDVTVDALARAAAGNGPREARHYVIHGDCASPAALATMARAGIGLNAQPGIAAVTAAPFTAALGQERARAAFPLRAALDAGVPLGLSSDGPVVAPDWRKGVAAAAERGVTLREALRGYTSAGAWQDGVDSWKGTLEVGKVADLCALAADPLERPAAELPSIDVRMTVVGGEVVYETALA